jgi:hypothetical protein
MVNNQKQSYSSGSLTLAQKLSQGVLLLANHISRVRAGELPRKILQDVEEYDELCHHYLGRPLIETKVFEIGYGTRPYRLATLISLGIDASGVDLDVPLLNINFRTFGEIYKKNGLERLLKSVLRFFFADLHENKQIKRMLASRDKTLMIPIERLLTGDATEVICNIGSVDLFISEDVFEHIPRAGLERIVALMAEKLSPDGLAFIRPNIFTGISGGHRVEWFENNIGKRWCCGWSEPWGHLRNDGITGDTYLNMLSRSDYRTLFYTYFDVLLERVKHPDLGASYLTDSVAGELTAWPKEELFSNQVLFVLKKKRNIDG